MNSISDRLKKSREDPRKSPKAGVRATAERKRWSQPSMGEMKPIRARRLKTSWRQPTRMRAKTDWRKLIWFGCLIRRRRINRGPSRRKGSRRGANTATTRELGKVARAEKSTKRVEAHGIERVEERERGVKPGETGAKNRKSGKTLKLSLRGSVDI